MNSELQSEYEHVIVGAGLVGALCALFLKKYSNSIALFESYEDLRYDVIPGGRSIYLIVTRKALDAFEAVGIKEEVLKATMPIRGQMIHNLDGTVTQIEYGNNENELSYCMSRNKLNEILLTIVENNNIPIFFQHQLVDGELDKRMYKFKKTKGDEESEVFVKGQYCYGTDGAGSKVRELILGLTGEEADIDWFEADYKEMFLPAEPESEFDGFAYDPEWVHIWPRVGKVVMAHPNANKSFSLNVILPSDGPYSFSELDTEEKTTEFFHEFFPDLEKKIPNVGMQFTENQVGYVGTVKCPVWHYEDKAVLLGDAAHAILPFLWQAVNIGMDDCLHFDKIVSQNGFNEESFRLYEKRQKPKANALAKMAFDNFDVLSTRITEPEFLEMRKLEKEIEKKYPDKFWSKYRLIFFGEKSYDQILELYPKYDQLLKEIKEKNISRENLSEFLDSKLQKESSDSDACTIF